MHSIELPWCLNAVWTTNWWINFTDSLNCTSWDGTNVEWCVGSIQFVNLFAGEPEGLPHFWYSIWPLYASYI
jgi:hypothetical protein